VANGSPFFFAGGQELPAQATQAPLHAIFIAALLLNLPGLGQLVMIVIRTYVRPNMGWLDKCYF